jgi:HK97 family phage prohead protease
MNLNLEQLGERLTTLSNGARGVRTQMPVAITIPKDLGADAAVIDMRASDDTLDRYGEVIVAAGWELDHYQKNPVIQNAHQYGDIIFTIGKALKTEVQSNELVQRWQFAVEVNPMARIAYGLYKGGFLHTSSVGFIPKKWENGNKETAYSRKYLKQELLEVSAVGIPANPNALALALKSGAVERDDLQESFEILKSICKDKADTQTDASTPGLGVDGVQSLLLEIELLRTAMCVAGKL